MPKHLWEVKHPYYATMGCFYSNDCHQQYESWGDFIEEWGDANADLNLLYRWDWRPAGEELGFDHDTLQLFFMLQSKAAPLSIEVKVKREDEAAAKKFLRARWRRMVSIWTPFSER